MSVGEIVLLIVGFVEFIIILVVCSKGTDLESAPGMLYRLPSHDYEKDVLQRENYSLRSRLDSAMHELRYLRGGWDIDAMRKILERPVEVNIENIIKVESNEQNGSVPKNPTYRG